MTVQTKLQVIDADAHVVETEITLPFVTADQSGPKHLAMTLSRSRFEQLVEELLQRTVGPVKRALSDAGLEPSQIDEIVMVGGSTRVPRVQAIVQEVFGKDPHKGVNPDEVVALGAALQAGGLSGEVKDLLLLDVQGTDSIEGGEASKTFERQAALFVLGLLRGGVVLLGVVEAAPHSERVEVVPRQEGL